MLCGYARVSTAHQDPALQLDALGAAGCERIWTDVAGGARVDRPAWLELQSHVREGDTIVVWKLDRFARSLSHLVTSLADLNTRGIGFRSLTEAIDTTSSTGRLLIHVVGALAEFERELITERTEAGIAAARARGQHLGRPATVTGDQARAAVRMLEGGGMNKADVARAFGVTRQALNRAIQRLDAGE